MKGTCLLESDDVHGLVVRAKYQRSPLTCTHTAAQVCSIIGGKVHRVSCGTH